MMLSRRVSVLARALANARSLVPFYAGMAIDTGPKLCPTSGVRALSLSSGSRWRKEVQKQAKFPRVSNLPASGSDVIRFEYDGTAASLEALAKQCTGMLEARALGLSFQQALVKALRALAAESTALYLDQVSCIVLESSGATAVRIVNTSKAVREAADTKAEPSVIANVKGHGVAGTDGSPDRALLLDVHLVEQGVKEDRNDLLIRTALIFAGTLYILEH